MNKPAITWFLALALAIGVALCGGRIPSVNAADAKIEGTYENAEANASIEFMAGGKAHFSLYGVGAECTYKIVGDKLTVMLEDEPLVFTINADGSLTGPSDTYFSRLKKKK